MPESYLVAAGDGADSDDENLGDNCRRSPSDKDETRAYTGEVTWPHSTAAILRRAARLMAYLLINLAVQFL
jgi:hypothetical protein